MLEHACACSSMQEHPEARWCMPQHAAPAAEHRRSLVRLGPGALLARSRVLGAGGHTRPGSAAKGSEGSAARGGTARASFVDIVLWQRTRSAALELVHAATRPRELFGRRQTGTGE